MKTLVYKEKLVSKYFSSRKKNLDYETIELIEYIFDVEVHFKKRKTITIQIESLNKIRVYCPYYLTEEFIKEKVRSKADWILKKLNYLKSISIDTKKSKALENGKVMYLGKKYPVIYKSQKKEIMTPNDNDNNNKDISNKSYGLVTLKFDGKNFIVKNFFIENKSIKNTKNEFIKSEIFKKLLTKWYKKEAERIILQRCQILKTKFLKFPLKIKVKEQKKRWGSCNSKGYIYFNWRIIMAPIKIIDYLIVHEFAHLEHPNHSKGFWNFVQSIIPDYKNRKKWLKENELFLDL